MQDRPSYDELLGAVERFLEQEIMPNVEGSRNVPTPASPPTRSG